MFRSLVLAFSLLQAATTQQYAYAVDINQLGTSSAFSCLYQQYSTVFVRAYTPAGTGTVDYNAVPNINMAFQAGLGIEVFITPNPTSSKQAYIQVDEVVSALVNGGISIRSLWIQATSPINWNGNQATNLNFINSAIQRIRARGIRPGVYTNNYDWQQITNQAGNLGSTGTSTHQESEAKPRPISMVRFPPFGNWNSASVKQFGQNEPICGFTANRDAYPLSSVAIKEKLENMKDKDQIIYVGTIGL